MGGGGGTGRTGPARVGPLGAGRSLAIGAGGALGAGLRWAVVAAASPPPAFPWPVLAVNVVGCAVLGILLAGEWSRPRARLVLHDFGGIGFCGGLTTFSTFALELARFLDAGRSGLAASYLAASVAGGIAAAVAGAFVLRRVRALALPLEERW